jgi:hypothetical protein
MSPELERELRDANYYFMAVRNLTVGDETVRVDVAVDLLDDIYKKGGLEAVRKFLAAEMLAWEEAVKLGQVT